jgi:hypothetical protein
MYRKLYKLLIIRNSQLTILYIPNRNDGMSGYGDMGIWEYGNMGVEILG